MEGKAKDGESLYAGRNQSQMSPTGGNVQRSGEPQYLKMRQGEKSQQRKLGSSNREVGEKAGGDGLLEVKEVAGSWGLRGLRCHRGRVW